MGPFRDPSAVSRSTSNLNLYHNVPHPPSGPLRIRILGAEYLDHGLGLAIAALHRPCGLASPPSPASPPRCTHRLRSTVSMRGDATSGKWVS
jgi:hypothetical protein